MPADMSRYPAEWKSIRERILTRAGDRCEWCGVPNRAIGHRNRFGRFLSCSTCETSTGEGCGAKPIRIVLTIAHVHDPDPMNVDPANLAALCQRCHNRHDAPMRRAHASETRRRRKLDAGQKELA